MGTRIDNVTGGFFNDSAKTDPVEIVETTSDSIVYQEFNVELSAAGIGEDHERNIVVVAKWFNGDGVQIRSQSVNDTVVSESATTVTINEKDGFFTRPSDDLPEIEDRGHIEVEIRERNGSGNLVDTIQVQFDGNKKRDIIYAVNGSYPSTTESRIDLGSMMANLALEDRNESLTRTVNTTLDYTLYPWMYFGVKDAGIISGDDFRNYQVTVEFFTTRNPDIVKEGNGDYIMTASQSVSQNEETELWFDKDQLSLNPSQVSAFDGVDALGYMMMYVEEFDADGNNVGKVNWIWDISGTRTLPIEFIANTDDGSSITIISDIQIVDDSVGVTDGDDVSMDVKAINNNSEPVDTILRVKWVDKNEEIPSSEAPLKEKQISVPSGSSVTKTFTFAGVPDSDWRVFASNGSSDNLVQDTLDIKISTDTDDGGGSGGDDGTTQDPIVDAIIEVSPIKSQYGTDEILTVTATIANTGGGTLNETVVIEDANIGKLVSKDVSVAAGDSTTIQKDVSIGDIYNSGAEIALRLLVGGIKESEYNASVTDTGETSTGDLVANDLNVTSENSVVEAVATVQNVGDASVTETVEFISDGDKLAKKTVSVDALPAGESLNLIADWTDVPDGSLTIAVRPAGGGTGSSDSTYVGTTDSGGSGGGGAAEPDGSMSDILIPAAGIGAGVLALTQLGDDN